MLILKPLLLLLNTLLLLLLSHHLRATLTRLSSPTSWSSLFLIFSLSWVSLRELFWSFSILKSSDWSRNEFLALYWMPSPLQFCSYLILPLFYAELYHSSKEAKSFLRSPSAFKYIVRPLFLFIAVGMVGFMAGAGVLQR